MSDLLLVLTATDPGGVQEPAGAAQHPAHAAEERRHGQPGGRTYPKKQYFSVLLKSTNIHCCSKNIVKRVGEFYICIFNISYALLSALMGKDSNERKEKWTEARGIDI